MKKLPNIEIAELFLVKTKWNKTFIGEAFRETKEDGKTIYYGEVTVNDGKISTMANTLSEVGTNLDGITTMKLDGKLHADGGKRIILGIITTVTIEIPHGDEADTFYLN